MSNPHRNECRNLIETIKFQLKLNQNSEMCEGSVNKYFSGQTRQLSKQTNQTLLVHLSDYFCIGGFTHEKVPRNG